MPCCKSSSPDESRSSSLRQVLCSLQVVKLLPQPNCALSECHLSEACHTFQLTYDMRGVHAKSEKAPHQHMQYWQVRIARKICRGHNLQPEYALLFWHYFWHGPVPVQYVWYLSENLRFMYYRLVHKTERSICLWNSRFQNVRILYLPCVSELILQVIGEL